jgi:hypothetical protein
VITSLGPSPNLCPPDSVRMTVIDCKVEVEGTCAGMVRHVNMFVQLSDYLPYVPGLRALRDCPVIVSSREYRILVIS